ncbi:MAG: nicotinate-nucleotide--dimethylbenzimidazole phosphoribosyltransferase [Frankiales bacterium]|nr:nicotinate-nucleotide--dimethylbenzimidazole phosphoribosyltransferase [Frankiales bacterium]
MTVDIPDLVRSVGDPDETAAAAARQRQQRLTKPAGALGRLEDLSVWMAAVQGRCPPLPPQRPVIAVFAADHGVAAAGVSAYPAEVTAQMLANFSAGGAAINVLARLVGARVRVIDVGVGKPSGRIDVEDAFTRTAVEEAFGIGALTAEEEVDAGTDLLIAGDMGIGNTTPAACITAILTGREPATVVGRGTGVDDATLARKTAVVTSAVERGHQFADDPMALLSVVGGADLAATAGFLLGAAARRTPVVLDGVVSTTAALLASALAPRALGWWYAGHRSTEPAQRAALEHLGLTPLLDLGLRLGEGTGAALAVPLLTAAAATLAEMATFDEAGVSDRPDA